MKYLIIYFNSIKVQLRHFISLHTNNVAKFQFHKGTIKTLTSRMLFVKTKNFNSIKVQLRLRHHEGRDLLT